jgi:hypothetical protein
MPQLTVQSWKKWFYSSSYQYVQDRGDFSFGHLQNKMTTEENHREMEDEYRLTQLATNRNNENNSSNDELSRIRSTRSARRRDLHDSSGLLTELESGPPSTNLNDVGKPPPLLRFRYKLWLFIRYLQNYEFKFALKLSVAVGILTVPAWIPGYSEWFNAIRGQWAALTVND